MGGIEGGVVELLFAQRAKVPAGALHLLLEDDAEVGLQQRAEGELPAAQERGGAVGVEDVPEGEAVIPLQDADVVVAGVEDLEDRRVVQDLAQEGEVEAGQGIDKPGLFPGLDLDEAELVAEVAKGIVLRVEGDDPGRADRFFGLCQLRWRIDERPAVFHAITLSPKFMSDKGRHDGKGGKVRSGESQFAKRGPRPAPVTPRLHRQDEFVGAAKGGKQQRDG